MCIVMRTLYGKTRKHSQKRVSEKQQALKNHVKQEALEASVSSRRTSAFNQRFSIKKKVKCEPENDITNDVNNYQLGAYLSSRTIKKINRKLKNIYFQFC